MKSLFHTALLSVFLISPFAAPAVAEPQYGALFPKEKIDNLRRNAETFGWAKAERDKVFKAAAKWVALDDETLWRLIPGQGLPRCIDVTWDYNYPKKQRLSCLVCGDKILEFGNYPYEPDILGKPWKLTCPSCKTVFPTNDFGKFYESGIDEHGLFDPKKGDRSLLFNTEHPDPNDPLHMFGVDDGFGYVDKDGRAHKYIGYYGWKLWREISAAHGALSQAYLYSGDPVHARKAAILLDRIADVYPSMDWKAYADLGWYHSDGSRRKGKIEGSIWECNNFRQLALSCDRIRSGVDENPELYAFLRKQGERFKLPSPKGTRDDFVKNIKENLLRCGAQAILDRRIDGNMGMHQLSMAYAAIAFNANPETETWLDWIFAPDGGGIPRGLTNQIDRDGVGDEGSPAYALALWGGTLSALAETLREYPAYTKHDLFRDYPNFVKTYTAGARIALLNWVTPNIGDTGATGKVDKIYSDQVMMARGFKQTRDPEIAAAAWRANGGTAKGLGRDAFDRDPLAVERDIEAIAKSAEALRETGHNMAGYGIASLEFGDGPTGKGLWMYYGRNWGHGHLDRLNFGLYAFGSDITPDLGYPEFAANHPPRNHWNNNTISHNTVVVDKKGQKENWTGYPVAFRQFEDFGVVEVESPEVYPQTSEYARTIIYVSTPDGNAYAVDVFRVTGGADHLYSFHGPPGPVAAEGLKLVRQKEGTYAGETVPFATVANNVPSGYSWLHDVERDADPPASFVLDWTAEAGYRGLKKEDAIHLRLHALTACDDVALADGDPPNNKPGNPKSIRYALLHREPTNANGGADTNAEFRSAFVSVVEPYKKTPFIRSVRLLAPKPVMGVPMKEGIGDVVCVRVELSDGTVDYLLNNRRAAPVAFENGPSFAGRYGFLRVKDGKPVTARMHHGDALSFPGVELRAKPAAYTGKVVRMDKGNDPAARGRIWVDAKLPESDALAGRWIYIENDRARNAAYQIRSVEKDGDLARISCGQVTFVRGFKDANDYAKGYVHNFEEGAGFVIPTDASWNAGK